MKTNWWLSIISAFALCCESLGMFVVSLHDLPWSFCNCEAEIKDWVLPVHGLLLLDWLKLEKRWVLGMLPIVWLLDLLLPNFMSEMSLSWRVEGLDVPM